MNLDKRDWPPRRSYRDRREIMAKIERERTPVDLGQPVLIVLALILTLIIILEMT